ncbi:hypothetical protein [Streptomyces sp. A012304]|uniref:hypothetical protein n=1 Tax=Streptomyces sp. A012304 TaxID=375446 RepID=UPI00223183CD|nr:hypothetical protein [Streptomyces sp. A012304]GKQ33594.1 hypothetical protein ALMP_01450 [Streptomyces sp. A012304]
MNRALHSVVATLMAGSSLLAVAACSDNDSGTSRPIQSAATIGTPASTESQAAPAAVARLKGDNGIDAKIQSVQRKDGMVLVRFEVTNRGSKNYLTVDWRDGSDVYTLAGSSIVDRTHKKRYMALIDSSGRCLCSEHTGSIDKGQTKQLYAQFEAPPSDVKQVDLALGNLSVVTVPLQEG